MTQMEMYTTAKKMAEDIISKAAEHSDDILEQMSIVGHAVAITLHAYATARGKNVPAEIASFADYVQRINRCITHHDNY